MTITSNIGQVIQNLKMLDKEIPTLLMRIMEGEQLFSLLRSIAREVLSVHIHKKAGGLAGPDLRIIEDEFINAITNGLTRRVTRQGVEFSAHFDEAYSTPPSLAEASELNIGAHTKTGRIRKAFLQPVNSPGFAQGTGSILDDDENLQSVRAAIMAWVEMEKDKDHRDAGKTDAEIADDIMFIMGVHQTRAPHGDSDLRRDAMERLMPHIEDFIQRASSGQVPGLETKVVQTIDDATMTGWLNLVIEAWRARVPEFLREQIEIELEKATAKLKM